MGPTMSRVGQPSVSGRTQRKVFSRRTDAGGSNMIVNAGASHLAPATHPSSFSVASSCPRTLDHSLEMVRSSRLGRAQAFMASGGIAQDFSTFYGAPLQTSGRRCSLFPGLDAAPFGSNSPRDEVRATSCMLRSTQWSRLALGFPQIHLPGWIKDPTPLFVSGRDIGCPGERTGSYTPHMDTSHRV